MGGSSWNDDFYEAREVTRKATGASAFAYHDTMSKVKAADRKVHAKMDPKGVMFRESRDSEAHPESLAVSIVFDVTGSMHTCPVSCQKQLPKLNKLLTETGFVKDPQIMFSCVGDTTCDPGSVQVGQFESGIEMDDDLGRLWLVGGGGGSNEESYQNALYFYARHTSLDCFEKRGKKGYLFLIGDEKPYARVSKHEVKDLFGDTLQSDISTTDIVKEVQEKYHVFFLIPRNSSNGASSEIRRTWTNLLGENRVLSVNNIDHVSEVVAAQIALAEGVTRGAIREALLKRVAQDESISKDIDFIIPETDAAVPAVTGNIRL